MIRVDPLTGERTLLVESQETWLVADAAAPEPEARPELFTEFAALGAVELMPTGVWGSMDAAACTAALATCREAMRAHADASYVHLDGHDAEARLVALPFVPAAVARERERFGAYANRTLGGNLLGDLVQEEVRRRARLVAYDKEAVLLSGFAAAEPYALTLVPRRVESRFQESTGGGALLSRALNALAARGSTVGPGFWVRTAPAGAESFCWRIEIRSRPAGSFEAATGLRVSGVTPEAAAAELRDAI